MCRNTLIENTLLKCRVHMGWENNMEKLEFFTTRFPHPVLQWNNSSAANISHKTEQKLVFSSILETDELSWFSIYQGVGVGLRAVNQIWLTWTCLLKCVQKFYLGFATVPNADICPVLTNLKNVRLYMHECWSVY